MTDTGDVARPPHDAEADRWAAFAQQRSVVYPGGHAQPYRPTRSVRGLGIATQLLLAVQALAAIALLFPAFDERSTINRILDDPGSVSIAEADRVDDRLNAVSLLGTLAYVATAIVFIIWFHRARMNAGLWAPDLQRRSAGWAIGGWFCPVVNLWFPQMIAKDVVDSSQDSPEGYPMRRGRPLVTVWWIGVLVMWVSGTVVGRLDTDTPDEYRTYADWIVVDTFVTLVTIVPAVLLVRQITERQTARIQAQATVYA